MIGVRGFEPPTSWSQSKLEKRRKPLASFLNKIVMIARPVVNYHTNADKSIFCYIVYSLKHSSKKIFRYAGGDSIRVLTCVIH